MVRVGGGGRVGDGEGGVGVRVVGAGEAGLGAGVGEAGGEVVGIVGGGREGSVH